jgi:hypothetical protein
MEMVSMRARILAGGAVLLLLSPVSAQQRQTSQDEYTLYELLAPETASFKIDYEVTATTPGAAAFFNPIRKGSVASDEAVYDMMTGAPLKFEQVTGEQAKAHGLGNADLESDYIEVHLARPVPPDGGQARIRIVKTYKDAKSYFKQGDGIVFDRRPASALRGDVRPPANATPDRDRACLDHPRRATAPLVLARRGRGDRRGLHGGIRQ